MTNSPSLFCAFFAGLDHRLGNGCHALFQVRPRDNNAVLRASALGIGKYSVIRLPRMSKSACNHLKQTNPAACAHREMGNVIVHFKISWCPRSILWTEVWWHRGNIGKRSPKLRLSHVFVMFLYAEKGQAPEINFLKSMSHNTLSRLITYLCTYR